MLFGQNLKEVRGAVGVSGNSVLDQGNGKCGGPEAVPTGWLRTVWLEQSEPWGRGRELGEMGGC